MKIRKYKVKELKLMPDNPRTFKRKEVLERSLKEYGYVEPIVVNKRTHHIVGGNQRFEILKQQGIEEIEAVEVDLSEKEEKILNLALNRIKGNWDIPKLRDLLLDLDAGEFDISLTGFQEEEIADLLEEITPEEYNDEVKTDFPSEKYILFCKEEEKEKVEGYLDCNNIEYYETVTCHK
ncbi:ParB N-terminal domain-containing protein [candidate division WOR-3 bacterium]|nr:ParB N-terminal domain-containing protein [candidate division WOR-3 bacterium]